MSKTSNWTKGKGGIPIPLKKSREESKLEGKVKEIFKIIYKMTQRKKDKLILNCHVLL